MVKMTRSKTFQAYLPSCHRTYSCIHCRAHLANHDELISKSFQGSQGRAYLFNSVVNVGCGPAEERVLLTGLHAVADIYCENCKTTLGWKYLVTRCLLVGGDGAAPGQLRPFLLEWCWSKEFAALKPKVTPTGTDLALHPHVSDPQRCSEKGKSP
ncbi:protein yippee-like 2 isoform X1 [Panthera uncia]|uniref:protein yippee-like 2 isoform X1 n=1 Tax=Panthera uncia TaxID=29064 RepID=UPI0020FFABBD|nr:protein yippee-like 2 isoform X1 [Panthera uncia]XP_049493760.1 protein yippee-like 2 isoform X1 [Panthera uncia]XP_049493761.1 protein yippee-like 2 isoform X1 [Panthera uncia]XP_049493762.1 protein yippee-like 2 isoform X1 [Panthera uncia]